MDNGMMLIITIALGVLVGLVIQYFLWKSKLKDKKSITDDWEKFLDASSKNDITEINYYGDRLIWNKYLKQEQLSQITQIVDSKVEVHPELEQLKLNSFNKQLSYKLELH